MLTILTTGDFGTYELSPVNKATADKLEKETGSDTILFQTDWDYPGLARSLGWKGKIGRERCQHRGTDGTVRCPECDRSAGEFIQAAGQWLDAHDGCVFRGKGDEYIINNLATKTS
jgi:hypothetical protein